MGFLDGDFPPISTIANAASSAIDWAAQAAEDAANAVAQAAEDAANAVAEAAEEAARWTAQAAEDIGEGLEDLGEAYGQMFEEIGEGLDDAFSKEGWMTTFMEEYFPGGGLITAGVHMAAGNEAHAQAAAVKGLVTAVEAAASVAGGLALPPVGAVLGAGIGNGIGQIIEIELKDELPDSVQHLFPPKSIEGALMEMGGAMLGGALGAGAGKLGIASAASNAYKNLGKSAAEIAARKAAEEAVEKTTTRLALTALGKKMAQSPLKPAEEAAREAAGLPVNQRRLSPQEKEQIDHGEKQALAAALAAKRHLAKIDGATDEELRDYDQQIFAAITKTADLENNGEDLGQFYTYQHETLGEYYMRDGVVVWSVEEIAEANKEVELDKVGMTEEEVEKYIEDQWEQRYRDYGAEHPDWEVVNDPILGDYMVKEGKVVFGTTDPAAAQDKYATETARDRGFASVDEYKAELINSWQIAHQYAEEAGTATGEWQMGGQSDIVGDYMIKDGQVVFGVSDPAQADVMLANQLAQEKGFADADDMREETEQSWRTAQRYAEEAGTDTGEWQTGGQSDILGDYMIKDGVVVWGATTVEEAEAGLPSAIAKSQGFESIDEMKEELVRSWQMSHEYDVEAGTATGEWQTGGQSDVVGPYMIKDGEVVFGATTPEEAEAVLGARAQGFESIDEMKEELVRSWRDSHEYDVEAGTTTGEWQTGGQSDIVGPYMVKDGEVVFGATTPEEAEAILAGEMVPPGQEEPIDFDNLDPELPDEVPVDENGMPIDPAFGEGEPVLPDEVPVDEDGMPIDPAFGEGEPVLPDEVPVDEDGMPIDEVDPNEAMIAELRAQIEALQQQVEQLSEELAQDDEEPELPDEMPVDDDGNPVDPALIDIEEDTGDDAEDGDEKDRRSAADAPDEPADDRFGDGFDDFDEPEGFPEPELPEEVAVNADGTPVEPPESNPLIDIVEDPGEMKPAVMPDDPMDWVETPDPAEQPADEYTSAVMPDSSSGADPTEDAPVDEEFSDAHHGATPEPQTREPADEYVLFDEPADDPMSDPLNDPLNDPMANPDEEQNF